MDYNRIMQEILNIGEELLKSGAEIFRVEDSLYRMCRSYGFVRSDVYASQINIQMTVETPEGEIITQIRYIEMTSPHYDKLDQLNNLSRYVCANTPKQAEIHERYEKIAKSKVLAFPLMVLAQIVSGTSFAIFFGGGRNDAIVAVFASAAMALTGYWIGKQEKNPMIYNLVLAFVTEMVILLAEKMGIAIHSDRIMIGIVMVLISTLGVINGLRDVVQRNFTSGAYEFCAWSPRNCIWNCVSNENVAWRWKCRRSSAKLQYICAGGFGVSRKYRTGWNLSDTRQKSYLFRDRSISDMDSLSDRETIRRPLFVRNASGICICGNVCICNGQNK